ncbi:kelch-like protein 28 isoform X2 [Adelges cooleyi]|uniref:kelch-like protein 28 isoform X2 n=1 Tax=Adelges cooleyi TaxID=133065 RepID=UPI0021807C3C|nr:kelch-like protein 28 isoform X2 [Adelges cooleyi]
MFPKYSPHNIPIKTLSIMYEHFRILYGFFQEQTLCDVTLICDDGVQILAHKAILASASPMLLAMFNGGFKETKEISMPIKDIESGILTSIVTCAYTFQMDIQENNIEKLLRASEYFQFNYAKDLCYDYVKKNINVNNCINFMSFSEPTSQKGLYTYCFLYCLEHFKTILENESQVIELYELNFEDITKLISNDHLVVEFEEKIIDFIFEWIKYDLEERSKYLSNLLNYLRLPLISKKAILRICDEPLMRSQLECSLDIMKNYLSVDVDENITKATMRTPHLYNPNFIFAIKGQSNCDDSYVMFMDLRRENDLNWKSCDYSFFCPPHRDATLVVSETGILLAIGGYNELGKWNNCVDELDLTSTTKMWIPTTPLRRLRYYFSVCTQGKYIYVVGGEDTFGETLDSIECYDTYSKVWAEIEEPMPNGRNLCSSIIHNSRLYVFGGYDNSGGDNFFSSVDCYDLLKRCWIQCHPMPTATAVVGWVTMGISDRENDIYLFGSYKKLKGAYKMNINDSKWDTLPDMINRKRFANAVTIENDLFVVGKNTVWWLTKNDEEPEGVFCERYIAEKNIWQEIVSSNILSDYDHIICLNDAKLKTFNIDIS